VPNAQADVHLRKVYLKLGLQTSNPQQKYAEIDRIVSELHTIHLGSRINKGTTGTISERLCELGLEEVRLSRPAARFRKFGRNWTWVGDFVLTGHPYDLAISTKSYKAKERLLASGTGSLLTPIVGWGLFKDPREWSEDRARSYLYRGFLAIYMPSQTLNAVDVPSRKVLNMNGKILLRDLAKFPADLIEAIPANGDRVEVRKI
jgi:hypothetical protein